MAQHLLLDARLPPTTAASQDAEAGAAAGLLSRVRELLEDALRGAGLPLHSPSAFPSFKRNMGVPASGEADMLFLGCTDGYVTAIWCD
jgi:hypothetical protein